MITAIVDTNVLVQAAISPNGASFQVLKAHLDGKYQLISSQATLDELQRVLMIPHIRARHGWSSGLANAQLQNAPAKTHQEVALACASG